MKPSVLVMMASLLVTDCGTAGANPGTGNGTAIAVGTDAYALDQLAPAPDDGSGAHLLYAVIRVSTRANQRTPRDSWFTLVDAAGHRYRPVPPSVYVPIDHLDGLMITPQHTGAGVVAFPAPSASPAQVLIDDGGSQAALDAP